MRRAAFLLFLLGLGVLGAALAGLGQAQFTPVPVVGGFGNRPLPPSGGGAVAIFGDAQKGLPALEALAARARREGAKLGVSTGDLVSHADEGHWRLARRALAAAGWDAPFVVAAGNHDLKGDPGLFAREAGPSEFTLRWADLAIVSAPTWPAVPDAAALDRRLDGLTGTVLLLLHTPPLDRPGYEAVMEVIKRRKVRYVASGHEHEYRRVERDGTVFLVNGIGGDRDSWQFGGPAHLTMLEPAVDGWHDRHVELRAGFSAGWEWWHFVEGHLREACKTRRGWSWLGGILAVTALFGLLARKGKEAPKEPPKEPQAPKPE